MVEQEKQFLLQYSKNKRIFFVEKKRFQILLEYLSIMLLHLDFSYRLSRFLPNEYHFTPRTWILPNEYNIWYSYASNKPKKDSCAYILKPNNGAMGHG